MDILKKLKQLEEIPNAYETWTAYREDLTDYIISQTCDFENIALFGAGRCNDIDLRKLATYFEHIILIDKDEEAIQSGLSKYGLANDSKVTYHTYDLLGFQESLYKEYVDCVERCFTSEPGKLKTQEVIRLLDEIKEHLRSYSLPLTENQYKNSVAVGLHSQLMIYFAHIWSLYSEVFGQTDTLIYEKIKIMNNLVAKKLNQALLRSTTGHLYIGYEGKRLEKEGRIEGALQAENDLELQEALGNLIVHSERSMLWPFKAECTYEMSIRCITSNELKHLHNQT